MASSRVAAPNLPNLTITSPLLHDKFYISQDAAWPSVVFQTDAVLDVGEQLIWEWDIAWGRYSDGGVAQTATAFWNAQSAITDRGGLLSVVVKRGSVRTACTSVQILGTQPETCDVEAYLDSQPGSMGFGKILSHESCMKHFDAAGNPEHSFDDGFGMAQLTNPKPSYAQVWNWKLNVDGGLSLFAQKRAEAQAYLGHKGSYTERQAVHETVSRWNGGRYHVWDAQRGWMRRPGILCDSKTGNAGWDLTNSANQGEDGSRTACARCSILRATAQSRRPVGVLWSLLCGLCVGRLAGWESAWEWRRV